MQEQFEPVDILLVEDSDADAELTLRVLRKSRLANRVVWVKDGQEALDFLYGEGEYVDRPPPGRAWSCSTSSFRG